MSRAYDEAYKLDGIDIKIALEVGLLIECEFHPEEYFDSSGKDFDNVENQIQTILKSYALTEHENNIILNNLKSIQMEYQNKCVSCNNY